MKLSNMTVLFIIIILPIILLVSYYISLQVDTLNMQAEYNSKLLEATKSAVSAFEINTVEWNDAYSEAGDSKRRDVKASINTFVNSFATGIGVSGTSIEYISSYVPAVAYTLYDGFYIYSPSETKETIKDKNGVVITMKKDLTVDAPDNPKKITGYYYKDEDNEKILYEVADGETANGDYDGQPFTLDPKKAKTTYEHILKPFFSYSARYKNGDTDIVVNYTLDNYITVYGKVKGNYENKSGYLIDTSKVHIDENDYKHVTLNGVSISPEKLEEYVWYEGIPENKPKKYAYVYSSTNTKVYFDEHNTPFQVNSNGIRTNLSDLSDIYKKLVLRNGEECTEVYQALVGKENIEEGKWYTKIDDPNTITDEVTGIDLKDDVSAINYCVESYVFSKWVYTNLNDITDKWIVQNSEEEFEINITEKEIFNESEDPENNQSFFAQHKREVIKRAVLSSLNQAITSYSRRSSKEYKLPVLSETDWDQILTNVSIIAFVQNIPIGLKNYNNYAIATSTNNKEYVDPNEIYLNKVSTTTPDIYFHKPYCSKLSANTGELIGYRSIDYVERSYITKEIKEDGTESDVPRYYYRHQDIAEEACYYCLVQNSLFNEINSGSSKDEHKRAYQTALARERYVARTAKIN